jgi:nitrogen-specific signal transduction histidine kinase
MRGMGAPSAEMRGKLEDGMHLAKIQGEHARHAPILEVHLSPDAFSGNRPEDLDAFAAGDLASGCEVVRALAGLRELETLERGALAVAVHPAGAGFERAWLFVWDTGSNLLEGRESACAPALPPPLAAWVGQHALPRVEREPDLRALTLRPDRLGGVVGQAWNPGATPSAEPETGVPWAVATQVGALALRRSGLPWALVVGIWSAPPEPERRAALEAIAGLCGQAARSLDHEREGRRRAQHVAVLAEAAHAICATLNLTEVVQQLTRFAAQGTGARGGALWVVEPDGLRLVVTHGQAGRRERTGRALQSLAELVVEEGKTRVVVRATEELLLAPEVAAEVETVVVCPLSVYGRVLGALACYDRLPAHRSDPRGFPAADVEFVAALADLAGLALDQAGRFKEVRQGEQQRRELTGQLQRQERLAWLGELAGRLAQETRNPLATITAFALRAQRSLAEDHPGREYLEIVLRETERLERLLAEQLSYAPSSEGALRIEDLNGVVQDVLSEAADALVRRRVRLVKKLAADLPTLLLDRERIQRVVANMLESALESVGVGGRIRIESRRFGAAVLLELAHDGPRAPGELLEQVFVPFASQRPGGPGVGLGVAQQIVREHGGEIRVRSDGEWGCVFSLSLPVLENQDRRRAGAGRRRTRADRRSQ